jgi:two-component system LytT family response regulator
MEKYIAYIVDDEEHCTITLSKLLEWTSPNIIVEKIFNNPVEALAAIRDKSPDILFLDIEMPEMNGFDLLQEIPNPEFQLIFITAYDEFAIEAIKVNALAYLLKPIDEDSLVVAINKTIENMTSNRQQENILALFNTIKAHNTHLKRVAIPTMEGLEFLELDDIMFCAAEGNYTKIVLKDAKPIIVSKSLKQVQEIIDHPQFFRTHNSFLVNLLFVKKYLKGKGGQLVLKDDTIIPVSRTKKEELMNMF